MKTIMMRAEIMLALLTEHARRESRRWSPRREAFARRIILGPAYKEPWSRQPPELKREMGAELGT